MTDEVEEGFKPHVIDAKLQSVDHRLLIHFDAEEWFKAASDREIRDLAACGWDNAYAVADFTADKDVFVSDFFKALKPRQGYKCQVNEEHAKLWLEKHKNYLYRQCTTGNT